MCYSLAELKSLIAPIAKQFGVQKVSVFGSYSKGTANDNSDLDIIIEKGNLRTLFQLSSFRLVIEDLLKIPVDLVTTEASDREFLQMILADEVMIYGNAG